MQHLSQISSLKRLHQKKKTESPKQYCLKIAFAFRYTPDKFGLPNLHILPENPGIQISSSEEIKPLLKFLEPFWGVTITKDKKRQTYPIHMGYHLVNGIIRCYATTSKPFLQLFYIHAKRTTEHLLFTNKTCVFQAMTIKYEFMYLQTIY